jgi:hypothetical protein
VLLLTGAALALLPFGTAAVLLHLRRTQVIGDHTFQQLEEEVDWAEGHTLRRLRSAT